MNAPEPTAAEPRLTALSHGGGCGCKIAPGVLAQILKGTAAMAIPALLLGLMTVAYLGVGPARKAVASAIIG